MVRLAELDKHRDRPIVIVCKMGQQAGVAGKQLRAAGYTMLLFGVAIGSGILLAAPQLLPTLELQQLSVRSQERVHPCCKSPTARSFPVL